MAIPLSENSKLIWKLESNYTMKYINILIGISLLAISTSSYCGLWATTIHSRANCGNNESITWWRNHSFDWRIISFHNYDKDRPSKGYHYVDTKMVYTWRAAAVCWGESGPKGTYFVKGFHYYLDRGHEVLDNTTEASDCNIYDGWWD